MQKQISLRILVLVIGLLGSSVRSQSFETSQPIENLLTKATIKKIPVGRPDPHAHHVLMELPIVKVDLVEDEEFAATESSPYITETERPNPYASSGIFSPQKRQHRFKSLRPSYPFAKRRGGGQDLASEATTSTTEAPSTSTSDQGLRGGGLRSRFRFRPSILSSKRKNGKEESSVGSTTITTNEPALVESTTQASQNTKIPFRRTGGVSNFIRRNRPSLRRKSTTNAPITTLLPSTTVRTTLAPEIPRTTLAPTTIWITTEREIVKDKDLFDFDTPLDSFTPSSVRDRTGLPFTTTTKTTTLNIPKFQSTPTAAPAKTTPRSLLKRRRRPRPSANIVSVSQEEEKVLQESSSKSVRSKPIHPSAGKRVKGQRIKGKRRRRPTTPRPTTTTEETYETTTIEVPETKAPSRKIRRERIITSRRNNARSDFEPLLFEEQPRRSKIITQSSIQTERKIKVPLDEENSSVFRRDNNVHLKTRRNRIRSNEIERYSFEEEDGSFTWGYKTKDGSFKEETRGADCITRGRYGYIDDSGEVREYKYESGVPCKKEENSLANLEARGAGYFDYTDNRFVLPDGRRVKVQINQKHRARG